jgi:hypothetical protein
VALSLASHSEHPDVATALNNLALLYEAKVVMRTRSRCTSAYWRYEKKHLVPIILMSQFRRTISRNYIELKVVMRTRSRCTARIGDTRKDTWSRRSRCCGFADQLWVVTKDRAEWKELSVSAEDVSKEDETLRAGLNPDSPRPLTAISHISSISLDARVCHAAAGHETRLSRSRP